MFLIYVQNDIIPESSPITMAVLRAGTREVDVTTAPRAQPADTYSGATDAISGLVDLLKEKVKVVTNHLWS